MIENKYSHTAERVALRRAAHQIHDRPLVFDDPLALQILGEAEVAALRSNPKEVAGYCRAFRAFMAARSRFVEDELAHALDRGVTQYVVLGAGLDTFAYRNPYKNLRVYEVDHPATQAWKREKLCAAAISVPPNLSFIAHDFEKQALADAMTSSDFDSSQPTFFSWLGVTPYLAHQTYLGLVRWIASHRSGSGVVFDFVVKPSALKPGQDQALQSLSKKVAAWGEPLLLFFDPSEITQELHSVGFGQAEFVDRNALNQRYFGNRTDRLKISGGIGHLMTAWV